ASEVWRRRTAPRPCHWCRSWWPRGDGMRSVQYRRLLRRLVAIGGQLVIVGLDCASRAHVSREISAGPPRCRRITSIADHTCRSTIISLISAIALAGLRLFGQALAQFMMVWQR